MNRVSKLIWTVIAAGVFVFIAPVMGAFSHEEFTGKKDPVTMLLCCGGEDCKILDVQPGMLTSGPDGIRLRLTEEEARKINPKRVGPVDTVVTYDRIQPTLPEWSAEYRVCIPDKNDPKVRPRGDYYCFWAPPST
jgi:hypothetical protein